MLTKGIILILSSLGVVQALLLCCYLFTLKDKRANRLLAFVVLGLIIRIGKSVFHSYMDVDPLFRNLGISGTLMIGPFLWFYGQALLDKQKEFSTKNWAHLVPFALFALFSWVIPNRGDFLSYLAYSMVSLHWAVYLGLCWRYIMKVKNEAKPGLLQWYRNIVIGISIIWFLFIGIFVGLIPFYILGAISFSFLIYIFSYLLLKRHVFALEKYSSSGIDRTASAKLLQQIKDLFAQTDLYLDCEVSLKTVAEKLSAHPREISQVINENEGKNFSEFVNHYRIEKAKTLMADPVYKQEKIATIAYDCGFGNVTSFNLAFKAETQMTPSQYRNQFSVA